ncbi:TetR/AcrR family transcriptional regulator [Streptomonospora wellingtoniae]|uniref:TetR/AcrR family transcriptional regulator C-terminal domain-containing protein n=1 Tax=Streptomonospora wellingtoniae TaxID=3075544 RepID=A0ABU2KW95_9ACTN|nr:TetR/AcrR family transcriptional regulator C-terminal domain-containing protein [Streptomonospora sp. DSM 45055]MDT0303574.1 TetR/AcrR family transcriptional regulator C-terminal domain-containing protein [Streptomonospora sp. DSM 45055]
MARPRTPMLSVTGIRSAALALVDRDGLESLSMRRLAQELDVQAASLYSHYRTKEDLLADIANEIMAEVDVSGFAYGDWRHGLTVWARSFRAALAAHPNLVPVVAAGPGRREAALRRADAVHGGLVAAGWPPRHATMIGASTKYLVVGAAINSFARGFDADVQVYRDRYPNLSQAHRLAEHAAEIDDASFELALSAFLDGLGHTLAALDGETR